MFHRATDEEIKAGKTTDVYFDRSIKILKEKGIDKKVAMEVTAHSLPGNWQWAVLGGIEEAARLLEAIDLNVRALSEGTVFSEEVPVLEVSGRYLNFAVYETALLGFLCQSSGIATMAARCKLNAGEKSVFSFGARRMHPAITPMIERAAFIGGCDGVSAVESAKLIGEKPVGTMPHAIILCFENEEEAWRAFDKVIEPTVKRVALIDTFNDEKFAAIKAAETLGDKLFAVRLDTPKSRRGDFYKICQEVRFELDRRGYNKVKIFLSGGIDEYEIERLNQYTDAYGVGSAISSAPIVDFSMDIVEVDGKAFAKRGKMSGRKQVYRCFNKNCFSTLVLPLEQSSPKVCSCGGKYKPLFVDIIKDGKVMKLPDPHKIRNYVISQCKYLEISKK